jgi:hypothetical protein
MTKAFFVKAIWEPDCSVWVSESNIPGLVLETESLTEFEALMNQFAPELLSENANIRNQSVVIDFQIQDTRKFEIA